MKAGVPRKATSGGPKQSAADLLFEVLDLDGSGSITFKEFLIGIMTIVLGQSGEEGERADEALDDDEEEQLLMVAQP